MVTWIQPKIHVIKNHESSKQKVKTIDIQIIFSSIDFDFEDWIFVHCQH